jgi:hypothetical protein
VDLCHSGGVHQNLTLIRDLDGHSTRLPPDVKDLTTIYPIAERSNAAGKMPKGVRVVSSRNEQNTLHEEQTESHDKHDAIYEDKFEGAFFEERFCKGRN